MGRGSTGEGTTGLSPLVIVAGMIHVDGGCLVDFAYRLTCQDVKRPTRRLQLVEKRSEERKSEHFSFLNQGVSASLRLFLLSSLPFPREFGKEVKFVVAKKADSLYKTVSAASIVAKVGFPACHYRW